MRSFGEARIHRFGEDGSCLSCEVPRVSRTQPPDFKTDDLGERTIASPHA